MQVAVVTFDAAPVGEKQETVERVMGVIHAGEAALR